MTSISPVIWIDQVRTHITDVTHDPKSCSINNWTCPLLTGHSTIGLRGYAPCPDPVSLPGTPGQSLTYHTNSQVGPDIAGLIGRQLGLPTRIQGVTHTDSGLAKQRYNKILYICVECFRTSPESVRNLLGSPRGAAAATTNSPPRLNQVYMRNDKYCYQTGKRNKMRDAN